MERIKIIRCESKPTKSGKTFYEISLSDGRKVSGWEDLSEFVNTEIDLEITKKGDYWNFKYEKPSKKGVAAAPKSDRQIALECASRMESNSDEVIKAATLYLEWLKSE